MRECDDNRFFLESMKDLTYVINVLKYPAEAAESYPEQATVPLTKYSYSAIPSCPSVCQRFVKQFYREWLLPSAKKDIMGFR